MDIEFMRNGGSSGTRRTGATIVIPLLAATACTSTNPAVPVGAAAYQIVPPPALDAPAVEYRLQPLDVLSINVFQEPDLSVANAVVDANGDVSLPLVGSLHAVGMTAPELSRAIAGRLGAYLTSPHVSAAVVQAAPLKVTVDGSVEQPGVYALQGPTTLIEALAMARGANRVAALDQVIVYRQVGGRLAAARFNIKEIRLGREPNPAILPNDTVVVGFSNLKGAYRDLILSSGLVSSFSYIFTR